MKFHKLLVNAAAACLLAGTSGAAMAVDCAGGVIQDTIADGTEDCQDRRRARCFTMRMPSTVSIRIMNIACG